MSASIATAFRSEYDPGNPAADKQGMVKDAYTSTILMKWRTCGQANRSYEANLQVVKKTTTYFP